MHDHLCVPLNSSIAAFTNFTMALPILAQKVLIRQRQQVFEEPYKDVYQLSYLKNFYSALVNMIYMTFI